MPLRFAIMGTGRIAGKVAPCIHAAEGCAVAAAASRDADRAHAFVRGLALPGVDDTDTAGCTYDELLARDDIDAVYITLPNGDHPVWSERLLEAGKHVLCEKPLCWTREQAERLFDAATANDRVLAEAFMYLHSPLTARAREIARLADPGSPSFDSDASPIGRLDSIEAHFDISIEDGHLPGPKINVRYSRRLMGGSLMDLGCYPLSFARTMMGRTPSALVARAEMVDRFAGGAEDASGGESDAVDGAVAIEGDFTPGVAFHLTCSMIAEDNHRNIARLIGDRGELVVHHFSRPERIEIVSGDNRQTIEAASLDARLADPMAVYTLQAESFAQAARALEAGEPASPVPSPAWSIEQAGEIERVLEAIGLRFDEPAW